MPKGDWRCLNTHPNPPKGREFGMLKGDWHCLNTHPNPPEGREFGMLKGDWHCFLGCLYNVLNCKTNQTPSLREGWGGCQVELG